jgi:hypothetical protein
MRRSYLLHADSLPTRVEAWHATAEAGREVRALLGGFARNGVAVERSGPPVLVRSPG